MRVRESRSVWQERVRRLEASGLGAKEFARRERVNANTLAFWKWKLSGPRRSAGIARGRLSTNGLPFVELIAAPPAQSAASDDQQADSLELVAPGGYRIRIGRSFSSEALGAVLDVIGSRA